MSFNPKTVRSSNERLKEGLQKKNNLLLSKENFVQRNSRGTLSESKAGLIFSRFFLY
mgnify:CR=1 FL=1